MTYSDAPPDAASSGWTIPIDIAQSRGRARHAGDSIFTRVFGVGFRGLPHSDGQKLATLESTLQPLPDHAGDVLDAGIECLKVVTLHVEILMVEGLDDPLIDHSIHIGGINDGSDLLGRPAHRDLQDVVVSMTMGIAALPENAQILFIAEVLTV